ncbi:YCF48-related protein [Chloroflexota bacterium]
MKEKVLLIISMVMGLSGCGVNPTGLVVPTITIQESNQTITLKPTDTRIPPTAAATEANFTPTPVTTQKFAIPYELYWLQDFFLLDGNTGYTVGNKGSHADTYPVIMMTSDAGATWVDQYPGFAIGTLNTVIFTDDSTGYIGGQDWTGSKPIILRTENNGLVWNRMDLSDIPAMIHEIYFSPGGIGWSVGFHENGGSLMQRSSDGIAWIKQDHSPHEIASLFGITFPSNKIGYAIGTQGRDNPPKPYVIKSTDAGETWSELDVPLKGAFLYDVFFLDDLNGVIVGGFSGNDGVILVTGDGGESWKLTRIKGSSVYFNSIILYRSLLLVFGNDCGNLGCNALVLASDDSGESWQEILRLEGKINAIGTDQTSQGPLAFALYREDEAHIMMTHLDYFKLQGD